MTHTGIGEELSKKFDALAASYTEVRASFNPITVMWRTKFNNKLIDSDLG